MHETLEGGLKKLHLFGIFGVSSYLQFFCLLMYQSFSLNDVVLHLSLYTTSVYVLITVYVFMMFGITKGERCLIFTLHVEKR